MTSLRSPILLGGLAAVLLGFSSQEPKPPDKKPTLQDKAEYKGALLCRNCHKLEEKGAQFFAWEKTPHPDAYETLATPRAKEVAAGLGIANPQESARCLKCHVSAFGVDEKRLAKTFDVEFGVQCESCHGPGSEHISLRSRELARSRGRNPLELMATVPGEISLPTETTCRACHNPESPTYKEYKHDEFLKRVAHPNPLRPRNQQKARAASGASGQ